uniref:Uncharacterized protein n=1 Tax=Lepeophtheirus salmonis TaxID=72036 RepID=A0A0K2SWN1_LEPSM
MMTASVNKTYIHTGSTLPNSGNCKKRSFLL